MKVVVFVPKAKARFPVGSVKDDQGVLPVAHEPKLGEVPPRRHCEEVPAVI